MVRELIAAVLKQLGNTVLSDNVKSLYDYHFVWGTRPELNVLTEILRLEIGTYSMVFIVVDALDELFEHDQGYIITKLTKFNQHYQLDCHFSSHPLD